MAVSDSHLRFEPGTTITGFCAFVVVFFVYVFSLEISVFVIFSTDFQQNRAKNDYPLYLDVEKGYFDRNEQD